MYGVSIYQIKVIKVPGSNACIKWTTGQKNLKIYLNARKIKGNCLATEKDVRKFKNRFILIKS